MRNLKYANFFRGRRTTQRGWPILVVLFLLLCLDAWGRLHVRSPAFLSMLRNHHV